MSTLAKLAANRINSTLSTGPKTPEGKAVVARNAVKHGIFATVPVVAGECPEVWEAHRAGVLASLQPLGTLELNLAERVALMLWRLRRLSLYEAAAIGAAVEDAGLPPPGADPFAGALDRSASNREEHLKWIRAAHRGARENLTIFAEAADLVRRLAGSCTIPGETAELILGWASRLAHDCPVRKYDPEMPTSPTFLPSLGLPPGTVRGAPWSAALLLRAIEHYANAIPRSVEEFRQELEDVLNDRAAAFAREVDRIGGEISALRRRQEAWRERAAAAALLPPLDVLDRVSKYEKHLHSVLTSTLHELERLQARRGGASVPLPVVADVQLTVNHDLE
jgi:hypothetical protein